MAPADPASERDFRFAQAWAEAMPAVSGYIGSLVPDRHDRDDRGGEVG